MASGDAGGEGQGSGPEPNLLFAPDFAEDALKMMQLPEDVEGALEQGDSVVLKASDDQPMVMCTPSRTFELRKVETSNSVFLAQADLRETPAQPVAIAASASFHMEAVPTRARTEQLEALLARNPVEGPACGAEGRGATWDEIVSSVQASEAELRDGLRRAGALERGGRWMVLSATYLSDLQHALLLVVLENGWPANAVPVREAVAGVEEGAAWHVTHALRLLCADGAGPTGAEGETVALDPARLNRSRVQRLFGAHTGSADRAEQEEEEFTAAWRSMLPDGVEADTSVLEGLALRFQRADKTHLHYFPEHKLPRAPEERFARLFAARSQWTHDEIIPYIRGLEGFGVTAAKLLLKYTRSAPRGDGVRVYSAR